MRLPLNETGIVQKFGLFHRGVDFGWHSKHNQDVLAADDGVVIYNRYQNTGGYVIHIRHDLGNGKYICSEYGHLLYNSQKVLEGDRVKKGQVIAKMGASGKVTGEHLHFGLYKGSYINYNKKGNFIDPLPYLNVYDSVTYFNDNLAKGKVRHTKHAKGIPSEPLLVHNAPDYKDSSVVKDKGINNGDEVETFGVIDGKNIVDNLRHYYCSNRYLK